MIVCLVLDNKCKWIEGVKYILNECGMTYVWQDQLVLFQNESNVTWIKSTIEQTLKDQFIQHWKSDLTRRSSCDLYREYKIKFQLENYMTDLTESQRVCITKFRTNNNRLPINMGRFTDVPRKERFCKLCNLHDIGDEFHLVFKCQNAKIVRYRKQYLKNDLIRPSMFQFINLLKVAKSEFISSLSKFLKCTLSLL